MADKKIKDGFEGFGLAVAKAEGESFVFIPGDFASEDKGLPPTRWIEMCYDPSEDVTHLEPLIETITQLIDSKLISLNKGNITNDDVYLLIKSLANKYTKDEGF